MTCSRAFLTLLPLIVSIYTIACVPPPTVNWTGDVDSDWNNANNYAGASFPATTDRITVNPTNYTGTSADPIISGNSVFDPRDVLVQNGGTLSIQADLSTTTGGIQVAGVGSVISMSAGTLDLNSGTSGLVANTGGEFAITGGTIECTNITLFTTSGTLDMDGGTINNNGNVLIAVDGVLELNSSNLTGVGGANTFTMDIGAGTLSIEGTNTFPSGFETVTLNDGLVEYVGASQVIGTGITYYNLGISSGTKTTGADLDINNNLTIANGAILNPGTDDIMLGGNWVNNNTTASAGFTEGAMTVTLDDSSAHAISHGGGTETFFNLVSNISGGDVTVNDDINIDGTLTLTSGTIDASSADVVLSSGASISGGSASSHVRGTVVHTVPDNTGVTKSYPLGDSTNYRPLDLFVDQGDGSPTSRTYSTTLVAGAPTTRTMPAPIVRVNSVRHYVITPSTTPTLDDATVTITYGSDDGVDIPADLRIVKDDGGTNWLNLDGTGSGTPSGTITSSSFTTFSDFALASINLNNPLPIELVYFKAQREERHVRLSWQTASEVNNDFFSIEKSADALIWAKLLDVDGGGDSSIKLNYQAFDTKPNIGLSYYRLKQTDFDGQFEYFNIEVVGYELVTDKVVIYPNPANNEIILMGNKEELVDIELINLKGMSVTSLTNMEVNEATVSIDLSRLPAGVYIIKTKTSQRLVVKR